MTAAEHMTPAELETVMYWLGVTNEDLAAILGRNERTIRRWRSGRSVIPDAARQEIEEVERTTAEAVSQVVSALHDERDPGVLIYRTDEAMWIERPDMRPYPARWWRMVAARAVHEVPGVAIAYAEDPQEPQEGAGA